MNENLRVKPTCKIHIRHVVCGPLSFVQTEEVQGILKPKDSPSCHYLVTRTEKLKPIHPSSSAYTKTQSHILMSGTCSVALFAQRECCTDDLDKIIPHKQILMEAAGSCADKGVFPIDCGRL